MTDLLLLQLLAALKTITATVQQAEPGVLRYFAFQTKNSEGQDQLVMVEKYEQKNQTLKTITDDGS